MIETRIRLALPLAVLGRREEAARRLDEAAALLARYQDAGAMHDWHREARRTLQEGRVATGERGREHAHVNGSRGR